MAVIVLRRRVVAGSAVDSTTVIKAHLPPAAGAMAVGARPVIVASPWSVTFFASRLPAVFEPDIFPTAGIMALGTLAAIVT